MPTSDALPPGWSDLTDDVLGTRYWDQFDATFGFRASAKPDRWPAINEPGPSVTIDLTPIFDGTASTFSAGEQAVNALALLAMVEVFNEGEELVVLDWQHPGYLLRPHEFATSGERWVGVEPFPNGDYYAFLNPAMTEGIFGHPWEQTLCVIGESMVANLALRLSSWLPVLRRNGLQ
ncbi:MAG: DUF2716 domain-containing protein [Actinomycetota bacterium]|nr:DUF2716 domain-containing protein [Actinomycetota bacterium]